MNSKKNSDLNSDQIFKRRRK